MKALQNRINKYKQVLINGTAEEIKEVYKVASDMAKSPEIEMVLKFKSACGKVLKERGVFVEKEYAENITITGTVNGLLPPSVRTQMAKEFATRKGIKFDHKEKTIIKAIPTNL